MKHCSTMYSKLTINFLNHFKCFRDIKTGFPATTNCCTLFNSFSITIYDTDKTDKLRHVANMYLTVNSSNKNLAWVQRVYWRTSPSFMEITLLVLCFRSIVAKFTGQTLYLLQHWHRVGTVGGEDRKITNFASFSIGMGSGPGVCKRFGVSPQRYTFRAFFHVGAPTLPPFLRSKWLLSKVNYITCPMCKKTNLWPVTKGLSETQLVYLTDQKLHPFFVSKVWQCYNRVKRLVKLKKKINVVFESTRVIPKVKSLHCKMYVVKPITSKIREKHSWTVEANTRTMLVNMEFPLWEYDHIEVCSTIHYLTAVNKSPARNTLFVDVRKHRQSHLFVKKIEFRETVLVSFCSSRKYVCKSYAWFTLSPRQHKMREERECEGYIVLSVTFSICSCLVLKFSETCR